jgi:hypothetical protein
MKGDGTVMGVERDRTDFKSVRKNQKDYNEDWNESQQSDYQEFIHKNADESAPEVERFRNSFKTMHDLNDKFRPIDMEMP